MSTKGRALFNLIRASWLEDPSLSVEPWQVEDLRSVPEEQLFERLKGFNISLDEVSFKGYADNCESPEELSEMLWVGEDEPERADQAYLLLFELWRRLLPHRQSLSIFCDELDRLVDLYDQEQMENEEPLQDALSELERILDTNVDQGQESSALFEAVSEFCAHDLESFLYDYATDQIDAGESIYASELVDGFYEYVSDTLFFDFLHARLMIDSDEEEAFISIERILKEEPALDLLFDILDLLAHRDNSRLFWIAMRQTQTLIASEEDLQLLLELAESYLRRRSLEHEATKMQGIKTQSAFYTLIRDFDGSEV